MSHCRIAFWYRFAPLPLLAVLAFAGLFGSSASAQTAVTTYHYDNNRTGWNSQETVLTPTNVNKINFGLLYSVPLDDQVDAQPLFVPGVNITAGNFQGLHDVVYVSTENNTIYAIDSHTGTVLLSPNFGLPVHTPLGCDQNGPNVGDTSTPVIDPTTNTLYVIFYTNPTGAHAYYIHALDLGSLTDKVAPVRVMASHMLSNGTKFNFNAVYQRQRPALLFANGNVYAGFGSFCDLKANLSRGWVLGWSGGSLTPLAGNMLFDTQTTAPHNFYLSSVWMSGYGLASDDSGNILLVTGNSDYSGTTYDGVTNIQESVIKLSPDLTTVLSLFTPMNQSTLDKGDKDFGSGGVLVLPDQLGSIPHLAVAAGKDGNMFLMNEDSLGGFSSTQNNILGTYPIGGCWCGQSYYVDGVDGSSRIVSSGGNKVMLWKLLTSPSPSLSLLATSLQIGGSQTPGFFTTISSNGTSSPIIWAMSRPTETSSNIYLNVFNPDSAGAGLNILFRGVAGSWPVFTANSNIVPVVANGQVYIASSQVLQVFGLLGHK
jgi:hypothetical protein